MTDIVITSRRDNALTFIEGHDVYLDNVNITNSLDW
jgi:hypothetical protein